MVRRIRIPGLVDIVSVDDARTIGKLDGDKRLDRDFESTGPLFNRLLGRRLMRVLSVGSKPLPTMRARDDADRIEQQRRLTETLPNFDTPTEAELAELAPLVAYVRGTDPADSIGPQVQALIGRQFQPAYTPSPALWDAAVAFDAAARSANPLMWAWSAVSGTVRNSRARLAEAVGGDPAGVHATGIAVHNVVASLERMRAAFADSRERAKLDGASAACALLSAPRTVLRQAKSPADVAVGALSRGTLVTFGLAAATERRLDTRVAFQSDSWNACPAARFVLSLLAQVWRRALQEETRR